MRIIAITPELPYPPDQGGRIRMYNILTRLAKKHEVHLISLTSEQISLEYKTFLDNLFASVSCYNSNRSVYSLAYCLFLSLFWQRPYKLYKSTPPGFKSFLRSKIQNIAPDILLFDFHYLLDSVPDLKIPKVVVLHNLDHILYARFAAESGFSLKKIHGIIQKPLSMNLEIKLPVIFDHCVTVSKIEDNILRSISSSFNTSVIPNGVDIEFFTPNFKSPPSFCDDQSDIVFFGSMDYYPNIDGAIFMIEKIMPHIWKTDPKVSISIVGRNPGRLIRSYSQDARVRIIGGVDDMRPYIINAKVTVVPLRMGGGTRLKALEAAAMGKAIIGTSIGLEGLEFVDRKHILIADTPNEFAEQVIACLNSAILRESLGSQARKFVEENYNWAHLTDKMEDLLKSVVDRY